MTRLIISLGASALTLGLGLSQAWAQRAPEPDPSTNTRRVALWVLDRDDATASLATSVKSTLEQSSYQVLEAGELRRTLERLKVGAPDAQVSGRLDALKQRLIDGNNAYFNTTPQDAIDQLSPALDELERKVPALSHREDVATVAYEGYATLIRAFIDVNQIPAARKAARQIARTFPHVSPSRERIPQQVIDLIELEREAVSARATYVTLRMVNANEGCGLFVNGLGAIERSRFAVEPDTTYHIRMVCDPKTPGAVWPYKPAQGKTEELSIVDKDPFDFAMADDSFDSRAVAEGYMSFVIQWTDTRQIVGLSRARGKSGDDSFLLVRMDEQRKGIWSDGTSNRTVLKLLTTVFPEITLKEPPATSAAAPGRPTWAWITTGVGVAAMLGGGVLGVVRQQESERYRCTPQRDGLVVDGCDGVQGFEQPRTNEEVATFNEDWERVTFQRNIGLGVLGVGLLMTTVGIVGLVSGGQAAPEPIDAKRPSLELSPTSGGAFVQLRLSF